MRPRNADDLHGFVRRVLGLDVARLAVSSGSSAPFEYLCHAYFEPEAGQEAPPRDCVVWANRGGGKTMLGAVATLLDLVFKPGVQVRILGGSMEQASKMHEHLVALFDRPLLRPLLSSAPTARRLSLINGSRVEVLAGSQRSVRGVRVHKLRCDEVEELDPAVWEAAQLVTRSGWCGDQWVHGGVEAVSTMHKTRGTMAKLVADGGRPTNLKVFRWNAMDVIARCPEQRPCEGCVLWDDCGGRAKQADGFVPVDDLVRQWNRTSDTTWSAEMMCRRPGVRNAVYPGFEPTQHVLETPSWTQGLRQDHFLWIGGMDFGLRCPTVVLWALASELGPEAPIHVVAEYSATDLTLERHLDAIEEQSRDQYLAKTDEFHWMAVDPAGNARNAHSGYSDVAVLRRLGYRVRTPRSAILEGVEITRRRLDRGTLTIHPRCRGLITALTEYHFDPQRPDHDIPVKDGPDHWCDALRYMLVQMERSAGSEGGSYLG